MIQDGKGDYQRAESEFKAAIKLDRRNADAYRELATTYGAMGRADQAEATYKQAIELRHDDWSSVKQLGVFYFNKNRFSEAERCFREVIRLTPDSAKAYSNLGGLYAQMGRYAEATVQVQKSISLAPTSDGYDNLGGLYYREGSYAQAAAQYQKAIDLAPTNSEFWGNLADAYRWDPTLADKAPDTYRHAIDMVQREITVNPRDAQLHSEVAMWWAALGSRKEAAAEIAKALDLAPHDGLVQFRATLVYEQAGQRDRALRALQAALKSGYPSDEFRQASAAQSAAPGLRAMRGWSTLEIQFTKTRRSNHAPLTNVPTSYKPHRLHRQRRRRSAKPGAFGRKHRQLRIPAGPAPRYRRRLNYLDLQ